MNTKRTALWAVTGVIGLSAIGGFAWADTQRPTESPTPAVSAPTGADGEGPHSYTVAGSSTVTSSDDVTPRSLRETW